MAQGAMSNVEQLQWKPKVNPWLVAVAVIIPTFMEVLDTSIANVALNHIAGSMSASYSEATWVLTSYLIANAIVLPLTAWLGNRFQRKRFLLICILVFTLSSLMCGLSVNLPMLLFMRVIQGLGGGGLAPVSQAILMESFPPKQQGIAMALFGLGVVVAPVVGPILGGWLTDSYSWRWIFYINVPVGFTALWGIQQTVEDPPWVKNSDPGPLDAIGFIALSLWLGCQEVFLDKGQENDWLSSRFICEMLVLAIGGFVIFVVRELRAEKPMVDLRIFRFWNFSLATLLIFLTSILIYGVSLATPEFLQMMMNYTAGAAGLATSPMGIGAVVAMALVGVMVAKVEPRWILVGGFLILAYAALQMSKITLSISQWTLFVPQVLAGSAMGFLFVPANVAGTAPLRRDEVGSATGMFNLMRNVGGSVGIALVSTYLARASQLHQSMLVQHVVPGNPLLLEKMKYVQTYLAMKIPSSGDGSNVAIALMGKILQQQAYLKSFSGVYEFLAALAAASAVLGLLMRHVRKPKQETEAPAH